MVTQQKIYLSAAPVPEKKHMEGGAEKASKGPLSKTEQILNRINT